MPRRDTGLFSTFALLFIKLLFLEGISIQPMGYLIITGIPLTLVYFLGYYRGKDAARKEDKK
jgi:hypothetical protein